MTVVVEREGWGDCLSARPVASPLSLGTCRRSTVPRCALPGMSTAQHDNRARVAGAHLAEETKARAAAPTVEGLRRRLQTTRSLAVTLDPESARRLRVIEESERLARQRAAARAHLPQSRMSRAELVDALRSTHCPGRGDIDEMHHLAADLLERGAETAWYASVGASLMDGETRVRAARRATLQVYGEVRP